MRHSGIASKAAISRTSGFIVDGYERAIKAFKAEVRVAVEQKYADEWNASGMVKRWRMRRMIERKIADGVAKRSRQVSRDSLF